MDFYIIRLSFNILEQKKLSKKKYDCTRMELVEKLLIDNYEYTTNKKRGFVSFHLGNFISKDSKLYFATIGINKILDMPKFDTTEKIHYKKPDILSPWVTFLVDRSEQVFIIEKNTSVFPKFESLSNSIQEHLNNLLADYDLSVSIAPVSSTTDFWKFISENEYLYKMNLELFMPNLFGETNKSAERILSEVKEIYNANTISSQIKNTEGRLRISENDSGIKTWLDWIGKGGGKWVLWGKKYKNKKRRNKLSSTKDAKTFSSSIDIEINQDKSIIQKLVESVFIELRKFYSTEIHIENEDEEQK